MVFSNVPVLVLLYSIWVFLFFHGLVYKSAVNIPSSPWTDDIGYHNNLGHPDASVQHNSSSWVLKLWGLGLSSSQGNRVVNGIILVIIMLNIIVYKLRQLQEENKGEDKKLPQLASEQLCRRFSLAELLLATNNFDEAMVIGKGGFGKVYKGVIDDGETIVALKRLGSRSNQGASEFWTEIKMLSKVRHSQLVALIGYCNEFDEMILVYEYVSGGNLGERLYNICKSGNKPPLTWVERLKICIGAARALDYLHTGTGVRHRIIHRDVKSSNILLDEDMSAKVSDLGVSKICPVDQPDTHVSTAVKGSFGYFDPHYFLTQRLTRKSDVYAFGVVLLEVLCGRPAVDSSLDDNELGLVGWVKRCIREGMLYFIIDPCLRGQILPNCLDEFVQIAEKCLSSRPQERPTMAEVVVGLESVLAMEEKACPYILYRKMGGYGYHSSLERENPYMKGVGDGGYYHTSRMLPYMKSAKIITFSRMLRHKFGAKIPVNNVCVDEKAEEKKKRNRCFFSSTLSKGNLLLRKNEDPFQEFPSSGEIVAPAVRILTLEGLRSATGNFSQDMVLGEGAFGKVYIGWVKQDTYAPSSVGVGMAVAVKKLSKESFQGPEEWQAEVNFLCKLSHPNLVKLLGYCWEEELLLVYELMSKGSLEGYLLTKEYRKPLPWAARLKILTGAARGLAFLHTRKNQVIFRDFKSANILLDQDFNAKIADFGMVRFGPINGETHVSTRVMGTLGYAAPEYIATGHLSAKSDVYSFGVVLLETLTGLRVIEMTRPDHERNLVGWARPLLDSKKELKTIIDPSLGHDYPPEAAFKCAALILKCTHLELKKRPSIEAVLRSLEKISTTKTRLSKGKCYERS